MKTNNAYKIDTDANNKNIANNMRITLNLAKILLPESDKEMNGYVSDLLVSDTESLLSFEEQEACDKATD